MREVVSTLVVGAIGVACWFMALAWIVYWPELQVQAWAWVVDLWHPSAWPIILSAWYWVLPVVSSAMWGLTALFQGIAGLPQPKAWFRVNLVLWAPVWLYPVMAILLLGLGFIGVAGMYKQHNK